MAQLDASTTTSASVAQHLSDHNQLHAKANQVFDVTDYGATGGGSTDDTTAIQDALDAAVAAGGGVVWLPAGTYSVAADDTTFEVFNVLSNVVVRGAGQEATTISLAGDPSRAYIFFCAQTADASNIVFEHFTIEGNRSAQSEPATKFRHGFKIGNASTYTASNVEIRNVRMQHLYGDGVALEGCTNVTIENCYFYDCYRDGISMVYTGSQITIRGNIFDTIFAQSVDSEPVAGGHYDYVTIDGNYMSQPSDTGSYALTPWGTSSANSVGWYITNNTILGAVSIRYMQDVQLRGNRIVSGSTQTTGGIRVYGTVEDMVIADNNIEVTNSTPASNTGAIYVREAAGDRPVGARITGNNIYVTNNIGIRLWGTKDYIINNNEINAATAAYEAIFAIIFNADIDGLTVVGNLIATGGDNAVKLQSESGTYVVKNVVIADNVMTGLTDDAVLLVSGGTYDYENIMIAGNMVSQSGGLEMDVGTEVIRTGTHSWSVSGTPESAVTAPVGSIAVDRAGGSGTTLYVKESGTGNTGWAAV